jgi:protein XagA
MRAREEVHVALGDSFLTRAGPQSWRSWVAAAALAAVVAPGAAFGGAWTLPQGSGQLIETLYGWTGFGPPWGGNPPVNQGRFDAQTYLQYGLTDSLTIFGQTAFEHYALGAPTPDTYNGLDYSDVGLRAKLWSTGEWVFSGEATAFIPGAHDASAPAQEGNTGWAGEARVNAGTNFKVGATPGFVDAEVAYRLRTAGPPDEWHGDLTVGFKFTPKLMLMLQDFTTISSPSTNPTFVAWRQSVVEASLVYALDDKWSVQLGLFSTVWTVKTNTQKGAVLAVWRNF